MYADEKMNEDFYDWLSECPVGWFRVKLDRNSITYTFVCNDEDEESDNE